MSLCAFAQQPPGGLEGRTLEVDAPAVVLSGVPFDLTLSVRLPSGEVDRSFSGPVDVQGLNVRVDGGGKPLQRTPSLEQGQLTLRRVILHHSEELKCSSGSLRGEASVRAIPGLLSLLPPFLAIVLALVTRQVFLALFCGIWLGATFLHGYHPGLGLFRALDHYLVQSLSDPDNATIILFSMVLGGMVGVVSKSGGMRGVVDKIARYARGSRGGQVATWAMGLFIFFDDYANMLIVGNTMRPITDRVRISREKLAFIVDSTAAPVSCIAVISTWVGFQVGLIDSAFKGMGLARDGYLSFLQSIPFSFYSVLCLGFVFLVAMSLRDFGPMARAERRASKSGKLLRDGALPIADPTVLDPDVGEHIPRRWYNAMVPILSVIAIVMVGLYADGRHALGEKAAGAHLGQIVSAANSYSVLMWASFGGSAIALLLAVGQRILSLDEAMRAWLGGVRAMVLAMMILVLAWSIGGICKDMGTADYVIHLSRGILSPRLLPLATALVAALISFSTGTSYGTMAILTPIVIPMAYRFPLEQGLGAAAGDQILIATIGAVLSGSVFGDHCSPISDTTIMSSMASASDHIDHVRTQMPYALVVGLVACVVGYLPAGFGVNAWLSLAVGTVILLGVLALAGKRLPRAGHPE